MSDDSVTRGEGAAATLELPGAGRGAIGKLPHSIGNFRIHARLGEGGMGVVYAGRDVDLDRPAAIKLLKAELDRPEDHARLLREAQAMARFEHPNVVKIYGVGTDRGRLFIAMELVDGTTLAGWLEAKHSRAEILAMFAQVGEGLAAVHRAGLVHRDFKPQNVLVDRAGRARVADFGLARFDDSGLTRTGAVMGTPGYMAPEQQLGRTVDARADQYSFCVALRAALGDADVWTTTPPAIRAAITRGLAHDASERFAAMDELLGALRPRTTRRAHRAIVVAVIAAGGLAAIGVVTLREPHQAPIIATTRDAAAGATARGPRCHGARHDHAHARCGTATSCDSDRRRRRARPDDHARAGCSRSVSRARGHRAPRLSRADVQR